VLTVDAPQGLHTGRSVYPHLLAPPPPCYATVC